jgi:hypothetical protein
MQEHAKKRHEEVLQMIEALDETSDSDGTSFV